jgi:Potential Queuosine, Q, salvage protein family
MTIPERVREHCAAVAASARHVSIDLAAAGRIEPGRAPVLDPERHYLEGTREAVAAYLLTLGAINFGSGWFPTLRKRPGMSGYYTIAANLTARFRARGPWTSDELRRLEADELADVLGQDRGHPLIALFADALRSLGEFRAGRTVTEVIEAASGSAVQLVSDLAAGMPFFDDVGFWKRAQIVPNDLALAGVAEFGDLDELTIFADNLVPHVLHVDGVLAYDDALAERIERGELLAPGSREETEIRACAVHACVHIAAALGVPERTLDTWLWDRGQEERYKALPRHRTRTVYY